MRNPSPASDMDTRLSAGSLEATYKESKPEVAHPHDLGVGAGLEATYEESKLLQQIRVLGEPPRGLEATYEESKQRPCRLAADISL